VAVAAETVVVTPPALVVVADRSIPMRFLSPPDRPTLWKSVVEPAVVVPSTQVVVAVEQEEPLAFSASLSEVVVVVKAAAAVAEEEDPRVAPPADAEAVAVGPAEQETLLATDAEVPALTAAITVVAPEPPDLFTSAGNFDEKRFSFPRANCLRASYLSGADCSNR
jgi:hypothetical protein